MDSRIDCPYDCPCENHTNLYPPPELAGYPVDDEDTDEARVEAMKVSAIMMGLDRHTRHKALGAVANE